MNLIETNKEKLVEIFKKYNITCAYLFGSQANGKTHPKSDFDFAVRFSKNLSLQQILSLSNELAKILGTEVDLLNLDTAPLQIQFRVFNSRQMLYARNLADELLLRASTLSLYHDYKYYFDRYTELEMKRILANGLV